MHNYLHVRSFNIYLFHQTKSSDKAKAAPVLFSTLVLHLAQKQCSLNSCCMNGYINQLLVTVTLNKLGLFSPVLKYNLNEGG